MKKLHEERKQMEEKILHSVIKIQSFVRGFIARKNLQDYLENQRVHEKQRLSEILMEMEN